MFYSLIHGQDVEVACSPQGSMVVKLCQAFKHLRVPVAFRKIIYSVRPRQGKSLF